MRKDCVFYYTVNRGERKREACRALITTYCEHCKFYKTPEQFNLIDERKAEYEYAHRNRRIK